MNRKVYSFLMERFCMRDSKIIYAKKLRENDIKDFIEITYGISVKSVTKDSVIGEEKIKFRFSGTYLHAGFNNIVFEGIFLANDFSYNVQTPVVPMSINYAIEWRKFMINQFGRKYVRYVKRNSKKNRVRKNQR